MSQSTLADIIENHQEQLLETWLRRQHENLASRRDLVSDNEQRSDSSRLLALIRDSLANGAGTEIRAAGWSQVRDFLADISRRRAIQGLSPSETATFVFSLKQPVFDILSASGRDENFDDQLWSVSTLLDKLGLFTTEAYLRTREEFIGRQQQEMMELSTPVVELWKRILALPLIGTLDSNRTQVVMQNLLEAIVAKGASIAIIDITGVPTVDTLVAQHLLKTVAAARLMGAECIISGIRPQIAQTIIHLGVDLGGVETKATLADAFQVALQRLRLTVARAQ